MMLRIISCFILIAICSCGTKPHQKSSKLKPTVLPAFKECVESPSIIDPEKPFRLLGKYSPLSYAYTYNSINIRGDSLEREKIRQANANLAQSVVEYVFPDIELVDGRGFNSKTYEQIHIAESRVYSLLSYLKGGHNSWTDLKTGKKVYGKPPKNTIVKGQEGIRELTVDSKSNLQLFIIVRSYLQSSEFKNSVHVYIFDNSNIEIKYYDRLEYDCDIRDHEAFIKVMEYALEKIHSNLKSQ